MKKIALFSAMAAAVLLSGCASILNEKTQKVNVSSSNGKEFAGSIDGTAFKGPGVVEMTRAKNGQVIVVETQGCVKETAVQSNVDPKFFVNILSGGAFGSTTDFATQKMWKYADNVVVSCGQ